MQLAPLVMGYWCVLCQTKRVILLLTGAAAVCVTDLQYTYTHEWANPNLGTFIFTVRAHDVFNASLPLRCAGTLNYDACVFDGRGRRLYARALLQF
jgi:hypothetical protein